MPDLHIVYYTDPLCCWSWALRPQLDEFIRTYAGKVSLRYCMGGLIESWANYHDPVHSITQPIQMGPLCMEVKYITSVPVNNTIWVTDPPKSSYLACTAVKAASLQSQDAGAAMFRQLQEAIMLRGENIDRQSALLEEANQLQAHVPDFDLQRFASDLTDGNGFAAFTADLMERRYKHISVFPTLEISGDAGRGLIMQGYKTCKDLNEACTLLLQRQSVRHVPQE